ncbi:MAG TPA: hypothetical protein VF865_14945, partial [Acidobacteriaceae bacterium]
KAPGLDDVEGDISKLYGQLQQSDNSPTQALLAACAHAREEGEEVLRTWREFQTKELSAIDAVLRGAGRPAIDLKKAPEHMPSGGDEE